MGLSAGQYSMQCWNSTSNPDQMNRSKLLFQCFQLIKAMQKRFTNGEIAIPSTDTKATRKGIEICILYPASTSLFADIAEFLTVTANSLGLQYNKFVKQDAGITRYFNQQEIDNVSLLAKPVPDNLTEQLVADNIEKAVQFEGFRMNDSWKNSVNASQRAAPFQIPRTVLKRLHEKEGDELAGEIRAIMDAIQNANKDIKTSTSIITMIAKGAIAIAGIGAVGGELSGTVICILILWNLGFTTAAIATGGVLLVIIALFAGGAYLTMKDAANVLLVVNDTPNDILPMNEWIKNGERRVVPDMIPAAVPNSDYVSCGLFVYSKYSVKSFSFGTYGSAFGVSFDSGNGNFSVGMDCPNSLMGGNNSIYVTNRDSAESACKEAVSSGSVHESCYKPYVDVKIADHWGNVNWGRAVVMTG